MIRASNDVRQAYIKQLRNYTNYKLKLHKDMRGTACGCVTLIHKIDKPHGIVSTTPLHFKTGTQSH